MAALLAPCMCLYGALFLLTWLPLPRYLSALLPLDIRRLVRFEKGAGDALLPLPAPREHAFVVKERYKVR